MMRTIVLAIALAVPSAAAAQTASTLHISVVLVDADQKPTPVPRHRLLISDNPATAAPRLVITGPDGSADVKLRPGNYTVESDRPVAFGGKAYQWTEIIDIVAGRDATLALTASNAENASLSDAAAPGDVPHESDPTIVLPKWQDSVVALWTPTTRASGFVIDSIGLIATNQRVIGASTAVEVQLSASVKVAASVVFSNRDRDVALLRIDPTVVASVAPVPLACEQTIPAVVEDQKIFTIGSAVRQMKDLTSGAVRRVDPRRIISDLEIGGSAAGGPVFSADGELIGLTSIVEDTDSNRRRADDTPVVPVAELCASTREAAAAIATATPPAGAHLPVEPAMPFPIAALKEGVERRAGSLNPVQISTANFDVALITPLTVYAAGRRSVVAPGSPVADFANWSDYVNDLPAVLLVRVTPKQVEGFWTTVARGAAQTRGVSIPAIKHFNGSFLRMRVYCGTVEVAPVHPFKLERRVSDTEMIYEGLYAFEPDAIGPHCASVKLSLYSDKDPDKEDARVIDQKVIDQLWEDFAPYRLVRQ